MPPPRILKTTRVHAALAKAGASANRSPVLTIGPFHITRAADSRPQLSYARLHLHHRAAPGRHLGQPCQRISTSAEGRPAAVYREDTLPTGSNATAIGRSQALWKRTFV